jgi:hypothetical protein
MTTVDLTKCKRSLGEVLVLAQSGAVLSHSTSGEDFVIEQADEFDAEAAALGASEKFMSFLRRRSKETGDIPLREVRKARKL